MKEPVVDISTGPLPPLALDPRGQLGRQLEGRLRGLIRDGTLPAGTRLPSTRSLAADLGVSRGVAVGAYAQLAAEGWIATRRGAAPVVAHAAPEAERPPPGAAQDEPISRFRHNLRPDLPDLGLFPRPHWLAATRTALQTAANADLAYGEPFGAALLRHRLAPFLARTRGVDAIPEQTAVFAGSTQALHVLAAVLREQEATRIAVEDPGHRWRTRALVQAGLELVPVGVDEGGLRVDELPDDVAAVLVSPERHFPTGVQLAPERRRALALWATHGARLVIEHDYEGHLRYDRAPGASLQALAPEHVAYVGSASALLAPTLRLGWAVVPARLVVPVANRVFGTGIATPRVAQLALAELLERGGLERHLRRIRAAYRRRRTLAAALLPRVLPGAVVGGTPGGLFLHVALPDGTDEAALLAAARSRRIALDGVGEHALAPQPPGLAVGFAALPEPTLGRALRALGRAADPAEVARARSQLDSTEPRVIDNRDLRRYELTVGARLAGHLSYRRSGGVVVLTHTDLDGDLATADHGDTLVREVLEDVRSSGAKMRVACPLVAAYVARHPEARDLVAF